MPKKATEEIEDVPRVLQEGVRILCNNILDEIETQMKIQHKTSSI